MAEKPFVQWLYDELEHLDGELARMEAECSAELPDLGANSSPILRAQRLLDSEDPPRGTDLALCRQIAGD